MYHQRLCLQGLHHVRVHQLVLSCQYHLELLVDPDEENFESVKINNRLQLVLGCQVVRVLQENL